MCCRNQWDTSNWQKVGDPVFSLITAVIDQSFGGLSVHLPFPLDVETPAVGESHGIAHPGSGVITHLPKL